MTRRLLRSRSRFTNGGRTAPRWLQLFVALAGVGIVMFAMAGIAGYGVYRSYANDLQPPDEVIASQPSGGAKIYDRNGKLLYEFVDDKSGLRAPVKLEEISPWMIAATVSTEDWGFWENNGLNTRGLARAGLEAMNLREPRAANSTGGSSITQQLVKNIYISPEERTKRSYTRKLKETVYAVELTRDYSKDQILEWYLNQISYGGLYNGVEAASLGYFGKHAKDLNLAEAALLAGIPASPAEYEPVNNPEAAVARRNEVLRLMRTRDRVDVDVNGQQEPASRFQVNDDGTNVDATDTAFYLATVAPLAIAPQRFPVEAPHWVFSYIQPELEKRFGADALYNQGLRVTTTLDLDLQNKAQAILENWISEFEASSGGHNGAFVAIDPRTSEILVMVGSRDYFRDDIEGRNNNALAENSPGSTLKPFAYAAAFETFGWGTETEILDTPISFEDGEEDFVPRNPNGNFQGPISIRKALGNSLNIPAVKTSAYLGYPETVNAYKKFGLTMPDDVTYGPSVTVGGIGVRLVDIAYAYSVFANNGAMRGVDTPFDYGREGPDDGYRTLDPVSILQVVRETDGEVVYPATEDHRVKVKETQVIDPGHAYLVNSILSDPNAHCITYGCGTLSIGRPWGVKTGTSEPYEDSKAIGETWTFGYTPELVAGVWAGNSDNSPMYNITSTSISYRSLRDFMVEALADTPASSFTRPASVVEVDTCMPSGMKADKDCGRTIKKNLVAKVNEPTKDDDWWQVAKIDIRDGLLATELTPTQFVQERRAFVIPESIQGFARSQAQEWTRYIGGSGSLPTDKSTGDAPVELTSPISGTEVSGIVRITGKAASDNFVAYRLEFGAGDPPSGWTEILRSETPQPGGGLGLWNTDGIAPGVYRLRVVLEDSVRGSLTTYVTITISGDGDNDDDDDDDDDDPGTNPTPPPTATPVLDFD
jgi:membrane peptidoglycan carboxypeptidase